MIQQINKNDKYWQSFIMHLKEAKMLEHINLESPEYLYIVKIVENEVIGHITLIKKILEVPLLKREPIRHKENELFEYFVQTFYVSENYRRNGYGKQLQNKAYELSCIKGAYQMRSWSSYDKSANYQLKIELGFTMHPGHTYISKTNQYIPGVYFIKKC
jgi:GNAT superfamily N-acetyltransferase